MMRTAEKVRLYFGRLAPLSMIRRNQQISNIGIIIFTLVDQREGLYDVC